MWSTPFLHAFPWGQRIRFPSSWFVTWPDSIGLSWFVTKKQTRSRMVAKKRRYHLIWLCFLGQTQPPGLVDLQSLSLSARLRSGGGTPLASTRVSFCPFFLSLANPFHSDNRLALFRFPHIHIKGQKRDLTDMFSSIHLPATGSYSSSCKFARHLVKVDCWLVPSASVGRLLRIPLPKWLDTSCSKP